MAMAAGQGILAHHNADGSIHTYVVVNRLEGWASADVTTAIASVAALFDRWAPSLRALIANSDGMPFVRPIYAMLSSLTWQRVPTSPCSMA